MKFTLLLLCFALSFSAPGCSADTDPSFPEDPNLDFKIGQMLLVGFRGLHISDSDHIRRDLTEYHLGGVVLFDYDVPEQQPVRNIQSPRQLRILVEDLKEFTSAPLLVTIDQEGGNVARLKTRFGFPPSVSAGLLGESDDEDNSHFHAEITAQTLADLGINVNLAPVVDLDLNPDNPIIGGIDRSFSSDPEVVTRHAKIFIEAHRKHGILTSPKHFPGHGSSEDDSHLGMVDVTDLWQESELIPYRNLIEEEMVDMIMTAHIFNETWDPDYPATLSENVIAGILREELGFDGVVISDDMQMDAIREHYGLETAIQQAILAGVDILCFANNSVYDADIIPRAHRIIKTLVEDGTITEDRIDESYRRIKGLKLRKLGNL